MGIPYIVTHDGRTIRYPHPDINIFDSIKLNLVTNEVDGVLKFDNGAAVFVSGGNNIGRVGVLQHIEAHAGSYDIAHVKDAMGHSFATRKDNIFIIGEGKNSQITPPRRTVSCRPSLRPVMRGWDVKSSLRKSPQLRRRHRTSSEYQTHLC